MTKKQSSLTNTESGITEKYVTETTFKNEMNKVYDRFDSIDNTIVEIKSDIVEMKSDIVEMKNLMRDMTVTLLNTIAENNKEAQDRFEAVIEHKNDQLAIA